MSSGARVWCAARTALLLLGAAAAGVFMVQLPAPATGGQARAATHVPASDKWLALGEPATPDAPGPKALSAVNPTATMDGREPRPRRRQRGIRLASLGDEAGRLDLPGARLTGGGIRWNAPSACLNATLRRALGEVAANFGPLTVNSTCRSREHNARVGGARHSQHLAGNAVDFRIGANPRTVQAFLDGHGSVGGLKHYGGGVFHIDTGPRRRW